MSHDSEKVDTRIHTINSGPAVDSVDKLDTVDIDDAGNDGDTQPELNKWWKLYRGVYTQAYIVGLIAFTQPGIWNSLAGLGAGGLKTVKTANIANSVLFAIMTLSSPIFAILINKVSVKPLLMFGTLGYVFWSAGLYLNSKDGSQWLIILGACTCGFSAASFWLSESSICLLYPPPEMRGKFIAIWKVLSKLGNLISGSVTLGLNRKSNKAGHVSLQTYIVLISLQCLGLPISFLLSPLHKVYYKTGYKPKDYRTKESWKQAFIRYIKLYKQKKVLCLIPFFLSSVFFDLWTSNYKTKHFSVRVRALSSLLSALVPAATDIIMGVVLDLNIARRSTKARVSWIFCLTFMIGFYVFDFIIQKKFNDNPAKGIDWSGSPRYNESFIPLQVFNIGTEAVFYWIYWLIGSLNFDNSEIAHVCGLLRSYESLGACLSFVMGSVNDNDMINIGVSAAIFFFSVPFVTYLAWIVEDQDISEVTTDNASESDDIESHQKRGSDGEDDKEIETVSERLDIKA